MCRIDGVEVDAAIQDKRAQAQAKRAAVVFQTPDPGGPLAEALADFVDDAPAFARKVHATRYAPLEEWYAALRDDAAPPPETQRPRAAPQKDFHRNQAARALDKLRAAGVADVVLAHLLGSGASGGAATRRGWGRCCWVTQAASVL